MATWLISLLVIAAVAGAVVGFYWAHKRREFETIKNEWPDLVGWYGTAAICWGALFAIGLRIIIELLTVLWRAL